MISKSIICKPKSSAVVNKPKHVPAYHFVAASIGDNEWLNQTLKSIQEERGKENVVIFDESVSFLTLLISYELMSRSSLWTLVVVMHRVVIKCIFEKKLQVVTSGNWQVLLCTMLRTRMQLYRIVELFGLCIWPAACNYCSNPYWKYRN